MDLLNIETRERLPEETIILENNLFGTGSYGRVYKVRRSCVITGKHYALKESKSPGKTKFIKREISALLKLRHENIVDLHEVYIERSTERVWLLFEFAEYDLFLVLHEIREAARRVNKKPEVPVTFTKSVIFQILKGVDYMHQNGIFHRDLKPANILITTGGLQPGRVKVADFGFACDYRSPKQPFTVDDPVVMTQWYRAPEVILGEKLYTPAVDIWSVGCIFAEMLTFAPLFGCNVPDVKGNDTYDPNFLEIIFAVMGGPGDWIGALPHGDRYFDDFEDDEFEESNLENHLETHGNSVEPLELELLEKMLTLNPDERIKSETALTDEYFSTSPLATKNVFENFSITLPKRQCINTEANNRFLVRLTNVTLEQFQQWISSNCLTEANSSRSELVQNILAEMRSLSETRIDEALLSTSTNQSQPSNGVSTNLPERESEETANEPNYCHIRHRNKVDQMIMEIDGDLFP